MVESLNPNTAINTEILKAFQEFNLIAKNKNHIKICKDLVPEVPIFYCQKCGGELQVLWDPDSEKEGDYKAVGMMCVQCVDPDIIRDRIELQKNFRPIEKTPYFEDYSCNHLEDGY